MLVLMHLPDHESISNCENFGLTLNNFGSEVSYAYKTSVFT